VRVTLLILFKVGLLKLKVSIETKNENKYTVKERERDAIKKLFICCKKGQNNKNRGP
jgi:hypothetical protein